MYSIFPFIHILKRQTVLMKNSWVAARGRGGESMNIGCQLEGVFKVMGLFCIVSVEIVTQIYTR